MPSLNIIKILGHLTFSDLDKRIPHNWVEPRTEPEVRHFPMSLDPFEKISIPTMIIPFFKPENMNMYHQDSCNMVGTIFKEFHDNILDAIKEAHDQWRMQAGFSNLQVMAVTAIGTPGCLKGPDLEPLIKNASAAVNMEGNEGAFRDAVAKGVGDCFKDWQNAVTIPALPFYPAFAAFPGPIAPPVPNVPFPLILCLSPMIIQLIIPGIMSKRMELALDRDVARKDPDKKYRALFMSIEAVLCVAFAIWMVSQQVTNCNGTGPIPTFAPPIVPVGPVVGGMNLPGVHLMA
jgi:hypothetical protein